MIRIVDTGAGVAPDALERRRANGVGLRNVERRLTGRYGDAASLSIASVPGAGTTVELRIPIASSARPDRADRVAV